MTWFERLRLASTHPPHDSPDTLVTVTMSRELWQAVYASMDWTLPKLGDMTADGIAKRAHSERCFQAVDTLRKALHIPAMETHHGCHVPG